MADCVIVARASQTRFLDSEGQPVEAETDGWFYPGDLAEKLQSGHLALRGRDKDVVIRGGVNVYPAEVEAALQQMPEISESAVLGIADSHHGELLVACVVTTAGDEAIESHCRERLAPYKVPSRFAHFDALPKSNSGKIDKKALARQLEENV